MILTTNDSSVLKPHQQQAMEHVMSLLEDQTLESDWSPTRQLMLPEPDFSDYKRIVQALDGELAIDIQFHPDRIAANGLAVVNNLLESGFYMNQFKTGISNGGMNSAMNNKRRVWESRLFGRAYDKHPDSDRPKYGAINLFNCFDGACPRFGSCFLRLKQSVSSRCTLTLGDSNLESDTQGTPFSTGRIKVEIAKDFIHEQDHDLCKVSFKELAEQFRESTFNSAAKQPGRILDCYLEAQIHGSLDLRKDIEFISADSSFIASDTGEKLRDLAKTCSINLRWHPGFILSVDSLPQQFRGEEVLSFVKSIHVKGKLNSVALGNVAESIIRNPEEWKQWGDQPHALQLVKKTWHAMVAFGTSA